jgi:hypothetical protein
MRHSCDCPVCGPLPRSPRIRRSSPSSHRNSRLSNPNSHRSSLRSSPRNHRNNRRIPSSLRGSPSNRYNLNIHDNPNTQSSRRSTNDPMQASWCRWLAQSRAQCCTSNSPPWRRTRLAGGPFLLIAWLKNVRNALDLSLMTITMGVKGKLDKIGRVNGI